MSTDRVSPGRGDRWGKRLAISLLIAAVPLGLASLGSLGPFENVLRDLRFGAVEVPASGDIVFVEIDSRSLQEVGVWPWPRGLHAQMLETLLDLGATEVALDIDFSSRSTEAEDQKLATALRDAGGYAMLAAFKQTSADGGTFYSLPLPIFAENAEVVAVNVAADPDGRVRTYPFGLVLDGSPYASMASVLSGTAGPVDQRIVVDFSFDLSSVPRISASDVIAGTVPASLVEGKKVVVGATAIELHDLFLVPSHGLVPGAIVQILAAETMKQQRIPTPIGLWPGLGLVLVAAGLSSALGRRVDLPIHLSGLLVAIVATEAAALLLQVHWGLLLDTVAIDAALIALGMRAAVDEIGYRRRLHKEAAAERDATQRTLNQVIADNFDGILVINHAGRILAASRLAETLFGEGLTGRVVPGSLPATLESEIAAGWRAANAPTATRDMQIASAEGQHRIIEYAITLSDIDPSGRDQRERALCVTFRDITDRRANEERLRYLALHDPLTGALTRHELTQRVQQVLASDGSASVGITMLVIELNRFKSVNDALGHAYGDLLLKEVVARLGTRTNLVARIGGDSFAIALLGDNRPADIRQFCEELIKDVTVPYIFDRHHAIVGARIGIAEGGLEPCAPDVLLSRADMALSTTKNTAANAITTFDNEMDELVRQKQDIEVELRRDIEAARLSIFYQPQVLIETSEVVGVEALIRWTNERLGTVSPARFVPLAEETGLVVDLGRFILRTACREAASWPGNLRLAVNVSPVQFELSDVYADVEAALRASGLPASRLDIEITEGLFMAETEATLTTLQRLRTLGVGIALDDFGTGYSSLSYLGRLPLDKIKIDQSFVRKLPGDPEAGAIVWSVMKLAESLNKSVVAEGVETAEQAWMLKLMGCSIAQGYLFGKPMPGSELVKQLLSPKLETHAEDRPKHAAAGLR